MARPMLQAWSSRTTGWMSLTVIAVSMVAAGWLVGVLSSGGAQAQSRTPATAGLLAVIDVHEVARQLGERDRLQVVLDAKQQEFQDRLTLLQQGYTEQYEARRDAIGTPASAEQQRELEQLSLSLNTQILEPRSRQGRVQPVPTRTGREVRRTIVPMPCKSRRPKAFRSSCGANASSRWLKESTSPPA
ncbi:MAG: hypothetical protein R3B96_05035 [Pirellulaceae bacterium]